MVQLAKSVWNSYPKKDSPTERRVKPTELMTASALASSEKSQIITPGDAMLIQEEEPLLNIHIQKIGLSHPSPAHSLRGTDITPPPP
ncbi:hypothetical protein TNCV_3829401 [Trichonephila clavipes]|nr:hypothetical protein TNCV_3829401 [Trichonephila clavipes]